VAARGEGGGEVTYIIGQPPPWKAVDPQPAAPGNHYATAGQVWVCAACGKTSRDQYGEQRISPGWDESCMMNAVLCYEREEAK